MIGGVIARTLAVTGIGPIAKRCVEAVTGQPCGCYDRKVAIDMAEKKVVKTVKAVYNAVVPAATPVQPKTVVPCKTCGQK